MLQAIVYCSAEYFGGMESISFPRLGPESCSRTSVVSGEEFRTVHRKVKREDFSPRLPSDVHQKAPYSDVQERDIWVK